ncbi:MAG: hypothetical protein AB8H86_06595 [Polyangiales bacterium]
MARYLILLALLLPAPTLAQSVSAPATCAPLLPTLEADTLSPPSDYGTGFYRVDGSPPPPRTRPASTLEFILAGGANARSDAPLGFSLRVMNRSTSALTVMRAMDGSAEHMRDPSYDLYVREVSSSAVYRWDFHGGRCGMMNAVGAEDYVRIAPGAVNTTLPGDWGEHLQNATIRAPGHYEAWVVYRLCGDMRGSGASAPGSAPAPGEFVSNAVRFRVR